MPLTRRQFLQLSGVAFLGSRLFADFPARALPETNLLYGRTLTATPLLSRSQIDSIHLWPDSVVEIRDVSGDYYTVEGGRILRQHLQPMPLYSPHAAELPEPPFAAEVASTAAAVHSWCAADAPIITRIGHGGTARIDDRLTSDSGIEWLHLTDDSGQPLGWSQAQAWKSIDTPLVNHSLDVTIDTRTSLLTAAHDGEVLFQTAVSIGQDIAPGSYIVGAQSISSTKGKFAGIPWRTHIEGIGDIMGVYWHNAFGMPAAEPSVQMMPLVARLLYEGLNSASQVIVI